MTTTAIGVRNAEALADFDIVYPWATGPLRPGTTGVIRARDEARSLPFVLPGLLRALDEVVLVDNLSEDDTTGVARRTAEALGLGHKLRTLAYPFPVSRCGPEHLGTPADSVHSLTYFYEWCFSHVRTSYSLKWDGDMVLSRDGEAALAAMAWQLPGQQAVLRIPRHALYVADDRLAWLDLGLKNVEPYGYPMEPAYRHAKAIEWELRLHPDEARMPRMREGASIEVKWLDSDEFAHWTSPEAFADSPRTARKRREWELFHDLREGRWEHHHGLHRIEAPPGQHVVDHVSREWLPRAARPLVTRAPDERDD